MQQWRLAKAQRSRKKAVMAARSTFQRDSLLVEQSSLHFPSLMRASEGILHSLARLPTGNWTIEKVSLSGGRFGRSLLCLGRAEQDSRGVRANAGCLPFDRNKLYRNKLRNFIGTNFIPIRGMMRKFVLRHTNAIKAPWTACAHVTLGKNNIDVPREAIKFVNKIAHFSWITFESLFWLSYSFLCLNQVNHTCFYLSSQYLSFYLSSLLGDQFSSQRNTIDCGFYWAAWLLAGYIVGKSVAFHAFHARWASASQASLSSFWTRYGWWFIRDFFKMYLCVCLSPKKFIAMQRL